MLAEDMKFLNKTPGAQKSNLQGLLRKNHVEFPRFLDIDLGISRDVAQVLEIPGVKLQFVWNFLG